MYLEQLQSAFDAGDSSVVFNGTEFDALQAEIAADQALDTPTLTQYDLDELAAYRWKGFVAFGVNYAMEG